MRHLSLALLLVACTAEPDPQPEPDPFDPALAAQLQTALDEARRSADVPGLVFAVRIPGHGEWVGTAGWADKEAAVHAWPDGRYRIGSITKTFVASTLLALQAEGEVDLDDTVDQYVPDAPYGDAITLSMLLSHTSGLDDYVDRLDFLGYPTRTWAPEELVGLVASEPLLFTPGAGYSYSNAGYILLGMVVQASTGTPWTTHVRERFLDPLGLGDLSMPSAEPGTDTDVVGYLGGLPATDVYTPTGAWAAGEMVSDADDLTAWATALYGGDVLADDDLASMTTRVVLSGGGTANYGLGCQIRRRAGRDTVGHSGSTMGFVAQLHYDVGTGLSTALLTNDFTAETTPIDEAMWGVLVDAGVFDE